MKLWPLFVIMTILCWGAYVPTLHRGQQAIDPKNGSLRAFLFVGIAYFLVAVLVPLGMIFAKWEPMVFPGHGVRLSLIAGVLGAVGALGIILALKFQGKPVYVAPLVFAGAPIINTFVSMTWDKPATAPRPLFYVGIIMAAVGALLVLVFKPK